MASDGSIKITTDLDNEAAKKAMSKFSSIAEAGLKGVTVAVGAVSTALVGAAGYAIKTGIDFESAFAGVKKTVNATDEELAGFRDGIRDMAKEMPQSASAIAEVAEAAGQLGIKNESLLSFTEVMANLGVATNMSATDAATSLARLANITQMPQENFDRLGSTIVALGNNLATTESEITEMGLRLAGAGAQVGMSEAQIMGLAGAISSVGIEADAGGSAVSTVMSKMQLAVEKGGDSLNQFADVAGMSAEQFQQAFRDDAAQALVSFVTGLGTMEDRGQSAIATLSDLEITEIRQRDALLRLSGAGDILSESLGIATQAWEDNNALTKEAEQRYETMESRIQILKNNVTDLGIGIYDSMRDPIKNTVNEGITYVDKLSEAFSDGGLKGVVSASGDMFAEIATNAAEQAPAMVESAVDFIQAFADGIYNNRSELISAAGSVATTLGEGLAELLPASVSEPVKEAVGEISESFENGGLKSAVKTVSDTMESFGDIAGSVAKVTLPPLTKAVDLLGDNLDVVIPLVAAGAASLKAYSVAKTAATTIQKLSKAFRVSATALDLFITANGVAAVATGASTGAVTLNQIAVGLMTKQIGLATAAQSALNVVMSVNPIGLVVAAVGALAAGFGAYAVMTADAKDKSYELSDAEKEVLKSCKENTDALNEQRTAREESAGSIEREYGNYQSLLSELQSVTDANGNVKAGYEDRAKVITGTLSDALGIEIELLDGQIQKYGEVVNAIKDVITQKKAEAVLNSMQDDMADAYEKTEKSMQKYKEASETVEKRNAAVEEATADVKDAQAIYDEQLKSGSDQMGAYSRNVELAKEKLDKAKDSQKEATDKMNETKETVEELNAELDNYNALMDAMATGDTKKIEDALNTLLTSYRSYTSETLATSKESRNSLYEQAKGYVENLGLIQDGSMKVSDEIYTQMADATLKTIDNFNQLPGGVAKGIQDIGPEASAAMIAALAQADIDGKLSEESKASYQAFLDGLASLPEGTRTSILSALEPMLSETELAKIQLQINGENAVDGFADGVSSKSDVSAAAAKTNVDAVSNELNNVNLMDMGSVAMGTYALGLGSQKGNIDGISKTIADSSNTQLSSADTQGTGSQKTLEYNSGILSNDGLVSGTSLLLSNTMNSGLGSANTMGTGKMKTGEFNTGVGSVDTYNPAMSKGSEAKDGIGSVDATPEGGNFTEGFANGAAGYDLFTVAYNIGKSALNAIKSALGIKSPSREAKKVGKFFSQGFGLGIEDDAKYATSAAESMSDDVLNALDIQAMTSELKGLDISGMLDNAYAAINEKHNMVADRIVTEVKVKNSEKDYANKKQELEIAELRNAIEKLAKRPIENKIYIGNRLLIDEIALPANEVVKKHEKLMRNIGGKR